MLECRSNRKSAWHKLDIELIPFVITCAPENQIQMCGSFPEWSKAILEGLTGTFSHWEKGTQWGYLTEIEEDSQSGGWEN